MKKIDNKYKVIIIDPAKHEINYTLHTLKLADIYKTLNCRYIEMVNLYSYPSVTAICDEEARLKETQKNYVDIGGTIFANKLMLVSLNRGTNAKSPNLAADDEFMDIDEGSWVYDVIKWMPANYKEERPNFTFISLDDLK